MDERKRTARALLKASVGTITATLLLFLAYGTFIYWQTQNISDPKKCFTTALYKVNLCPSNPNYVRYKEVPRHFFQSLILSEDASFWSHDGFDWFEIKESFRRNFVEWRFARGGSTLTQQLAKNLYLNKEKSLSRKFKEFFIARQIEKQLSKSQILEKYINVVEFGQGIFGIKKASLYYFDKPPHQLNILDSIYLVSLLPSPKRLGKSFSNGKLSPNNIWRMKIILKRLYRTGRIDNDLFGHLQMLIDDSEWPFHSYSTDMFKTPSIDDQDFEAFEETELQDTQIEDVPESIIDDVEKFEEEDFADREESLINQNQAEIENETENLLPDTEAPLSEENSLEPSNSGKKPSQGQTPEETNSVNQNPEENLQEEDQLTPGDDKLLEERK